MDGASCGGSGEVAVNANREGQSRLALAFSLAFVTENVAIFLDTTDAILYTLYNKQISNNVCSKQRFLLYGILGTWGIFY